MSLVGTAIDPLSSLVRGKWGSRHYLVSLLMLVWIQAAALGGRDKMSINLISLWGHVAASKCLGKVKACAPRSKIIGFDFLKYCQMNQKQSSASFYSRWDRKAIWKSFCWFCQMWHFAANKAKSRNAGSWVRIPLELKFHFLSTLCHLDSNRTFSRVLFQF